MGMLFIITLLLIGMAWEAFDYQFIGIVFGTVFVILGWAVILLVGSARSEELKKNQQVEKSQTANHTVYRSRMGYGGNWDSDGENARDNSYQAGGLPRDCSPFGDINDPYERAGMEFAFFDNLFDQWNDD